MKKLLAVLAFLITGMAALGASAEQADVSREGQKPTYETENAFLSYDSRKEVFSGRNTATGESIPGKSRGMMIMAPPKPRPAMPVPTGSA